MTHYTQKYQRKMLLLEILLVICATFIAILTAMYVGVVNEPQEMLSPVLEPVRALEAVNRPYSLYKHIYDEAYIFGIEPDYVYCIVQKESGFDKNAVGDSGLAHGLGQFHLPTWKSFRKQMGKSQEDTRFSAYDSIETLVWGLTKDYDSHWTASRYCQELK